MNEITQEKAYEYYERIVSLKREIGVRFLELGFILKEIKDNKLYKLMGDGGFDTWFAFLANPEISIPYATANAYINVYELYINKLGYKTEQIADIPFNRLNQLRARIENSPEDKQSELIEKARTLSGSDFKTEMIEEGIQKNPFITVAICAGCNKKILIIKKDDLCSCKGTENPQYK